MGYYTDFTLEVKELPKNADEKVYYRAINDYIQEHLSFLESWYSGGWSANAKWYDAEEDMKEMSKQFPDVLFELFGNGEETGDLWYAWFKNGKMQYTKATVTFDEFDEQKMT